VPSNWLYIDTNFPTFTGEESVNEKINTIQNYMYMLVEQLRYSLHNLDLTNMNQTAVKQYESYLTEPIYGRIEDSEGNINELKLTAEGLAGRITDAEGNITVLTATAGSLSAQLSDAQGNITALQATAQGLAGRISNAEGNITTLTATANGLSTSVSNMDGQISALQQTVNGFRLSATNGETSSTLTLTANGTYLSSADIYFQGMVTFEDLSGSGRTTINGDNITTGLISADHILLGGAMEVYQSLYSNMLGGYLGYVTSRNAYGGTTTGLGIMDPWGDHQAVVTTGGARLTSPTAEIVAAVNITLDTENKINASTDITVTSDRRKKEEIRYDVDTRYAALFDALRPASFLYKGKVPVRHLGFIAQDVAEAAEVLGLGEADLALLSMDEKGYYGLNYSEFIPLLTAKIKELDKRIKELTT